MITLPRFISCIFIFPIIFGGWIGGLKWPWKVSMLILLFAAQLFSFTYWLRGDEFAY
jgi:hypothetical protein